MSRLSKQKWAEDDRRKVITKKEEIGKKSG